MIQIVYYKTGLRKLHPVKPKEWEEIFLLIPNILFLAVIVVLFIWIIRGPIKRFLNIDSDNNESK
jgi:hypothetical protein